MSNGWAAFGIMHDAFGELFRDSVSIVVTSSDPTEGGVSSVPLDFTTTNWNTPRVVTVIGVDDSLADGAQPYRVHVGPSESSDVNYNGLVGDDVLLTNEDDETARVVVAPLSGLVTTEAGGTASFTVSLGSQPTEDVFVDFTSDNAFEGSVATASIVLTPVDWDMPQTITVTGVDDPIADGDQPYQVVVHVSASLDLSYAAMPDKRVSLINTDNETAGITVSPTSALTTTEAGGTATFTVALNSQPTSGVTIALASDAPTEGTVSPASLSFTPGDWSTPQTVTATGANDLFADGARLYHVITAPAVSGDGGYSGRNPADVTLTNLDDDTADVVVTPTSLIAPEVGPAATFSVVLTSQPMTNVIVPAHMNNTSQGSILPASLTFTSANWNVPQTFTVSAVNDLIADGDYVNTAVTDSAISTDATYSGFDAVDVSVTHTDNDSAGVLVVPTSGLVTSEAGSTAMFTIVLLSQPTANVSIALSSSNTAEGTVSPSSLTFTSGNWNLPQTVTITGVNDLIADGDVAYSCVTGAATSLDSVYAGLAVADVTAINTDNDAPGLTVSPTSGLLTTEQSGTATFTIVLATQPTSPVTIMLSSTNMSEGTVSPSSVVLTALDWSIPHNVTITGVNDHVLDADVAYSIVTSATSSADAMYNTLVVPDVSVTNRIAPTYLKASNPDPGDRFGADVAVSSDGNTIAISSTIEASASRVINAGGSDNSAPGAGAVYIFTRVADAWSQQAYIKAANADASDAFGYSIALSANGDTLAVGAQTEDSNATGIGGDANNALANASGAAYIFVRSGSTWSQQAYIKASNTGTGDTFGRAVDISDDGNTLAIGAPNEASNATGVGGLQSDNSRPIAGAAYVFSRSAGTWTQQEYLKSFSAAREQYFGQTLELSADGNTLAVGEGVIGLGQINIFTRSGTAWTALQNIGNPGAGINFGYTESLSSDGSTLATRSTTGAHIYVRSGMMYVLQTPLLWPALADSGDGFGLWPVLSGDGNRLLAASNNEDSNAVRINGNESDNTLSNSGAAYTFTRSGMAWSQEFYIKAPNPDASDYFGLAVATPTFDVIAFGVSSEDSNAAGVNGNQLDNSSMDSGAVFVY